MSLFSKLFGPAKPKVPPRDVAVLAAPFARPALQLKASPPVRSAAPVHSWFLGEPDLAPGMSRPEYRGRQLGHLATIDLAEAQAAQSIDWLPPTGCLIFFNDFESASLGERGDRGAWAVEYCPDRATSQSPDSRPIAFRAIRTYPPPERAGPAALGFTEEEWDLYCDLELTQTGVEYCHKLGGYQSLIQGDSVEEQCEFSINDKSEHDRALAAASKDWRLLLQVASDDDLDFMWGDAGNLYFMIRERDARAGRFDAVGLTDQCF